MNPEFVFVDIQGFKDSQNKFLIKELALATQEFTQVFLIKSPYPYSYLTPAEKRQVTWIEKNRGIRWNEGIIDHREFKRVISSYLQNKVIIVKGMEKVKWMEDFCKNCTIIDIEENRCPNFTILYKTYCNAENNFNCFNHTKICALKNVLCIKKWYEDNLRL